MHCIETSEVNTKVLLKLPSYPIPLTNTVVPVYPLAGPMPFRPAGLSLIANPFGDSKLQCTVKGSSEHGRRGRGAKDFPKNFSAKVSNIISICA